jgi:hypothetical protein
MPAELSWFNSVEMIKGRDIYGSTFYFKLLTEMLNKSQINI